MSLWLHFWLVFLALVIFSSGCSTPKSLNTIPRERLRSVRLEMRDLPTPTVVTLTAQRMNEGGAGGGLIGVIVATSIASASSSDERKVLEDIRGSSGHFEAGVLASAFQARITSAGIHTETNSLVGATLIVLPKTVGLVELSRQQFTPCIVAQARLIADGDKKVWSATAKAIRNSGRALEDYRLDPQLYRSDFDALADDLARQLVSGPIRPMR
jgi:hypothetical protein